MQGFMVVITIGLSLFLLCGICLLIGWGIAAIEAYQYRKKMEFIDQFVSAYKKMEKKEGQS